MTDMEKYKKPKMVKIPLSLYYDLQHYFFGNPRYEEPWEEVESRIKNALRDKMDADERRLMYSAKLAQEGRYKNGYNHS